MKIEINQKARRYFIQCEKDLKEKLRLSLDVSEEARKKTGRDRGKISNNREAVPDMFDGTMVNRVNGEVFVEDLEHDPEMASIKV